MKAWSMRNHKRLLALNFVSLVLLLFAYLVTSVIALFPAELLTLMHLTSLVSAGLIVLSLASKGPIPVVISIVGIVLIYNTIISPLYFTDESDQVIMGRQRVVPAAAGDSLQVDRPLHFFLGVSMVIFGTVVAHKPAVLFTRNRPPPMEDEWSRYPIWQDNPLLADGRTQEVVPVKSLMSEQDLHLLWRYEYVIASVYGSQHLVRPDGMVPKGSTVLLRDNASGRIFGKPKFTGFFI